MTDTAPTIPMTTDLLTPESRARVIALNEAARLLTQGTTVTPLSRAVNQPSAGELVYLAEYILEGDDGGGDDEAEDGDGDEDHGVRRPAVTSVRVDETRGITDVRDQDARTEWLTPNTPGAAITSGGGIAAALDAARKIVRTGQP